MSKVTIEDISRHTGLSRGTVSRALNERPDISEATKRRVLEACSQLKYVPSHAARSLATGRRYAVAVVVHDLRSVFAQCFLRGVIARARAERYAVHVSELGGEPDQALEHLRTLVNERVDSVLLASRPHGELARAVVDIIGDRPLVATGPVDGATCDVLAPDFVEAGRLAARHIVRGNAPNVLFVHEGTCETIAQRRAGFEEVCRGVGLDPAQVIVELSPRGAGDGDRFGPVRARLGEVNAIAAGDDFLALELMLVCCRAGRTPGQDIGIIGQGNEPAGANISPTLSTIDFCGEEIGRRAMELSLQRVTKARQDAAQQALISPVLVPRESTRQFQ